MTEQSITILGHKAVVTNNYMNDIVSSFCTEWFAELGLSDALKMECPFLFGQAIPGVEQFEIMESGEVVSKWVNTEVSCTSTIPVVSANDEVLYCVGKRSRPKGRDMFTIEAIDWNTGKSLHYVDIGSTLLSNGLYAGRCIGTMGDVVMGSLSGVIRVSSPASPSDTDRGYRINDKVVRGVEEDDNLSPAWKIMQQFADWNAIGHVPSKEELHLLNINPKSIVEKKHLSAPGLNAGNTVNNALASTRMGLKIGKGRGDVGSAANHGFDLSTTLSSDAADCLSSSYSFAIPRGYHSTGMQ